MGANRIGNVYDNGFDDSEILNSVELEHAVRQLPDRQQAVIALRFAGFTQVSITDLLGISRTTVWADEKEALTRLRGILAAEND